ncbi:MAG: polysaccharide pyruvyl transferase family protein [Algicola sp.]|nr:polysaccharide pyruvyl transferase family protein [Algicola sp.]
MKIKTITCHDVYNHGAALQAYALMKYLKKNNHDVEIINYKPDYLSNHYRLFNISNPKYSRNKILALAYILAKLPRRILSLSRKRSFDKFNEKYLKLTKRYNSYEELKSSPPDADVYICGSDQIWNTLHQNGRDPAFYLDFGLPTTKKLSYSASLASEYIFEGYENFVFEKVTSLDFIACRETSGVHILNELGLLNVTHTMDPAFLLSKDEWNEVAEEKFDENYILIYDFESSDKIKNKAQNIAEKKGWKIYTINPGDFSYADKRFDNVGPETFLSLIRDAKLVISNSFHAVVFPLIYGTPFMIEERSENINARMKDIFMTIGCKEQYESGDIVYLSDEIKKILKEKIDVSKSYLLNSICA